MAVRRSTTALVIIAIAMSQIGCFPARTVWRPGATGAVVDHVTGQPLQGASACLEGPLSYEGDGKSMVRNATRTTLVTGNDGYFTFEPVKEWWMRPVVFGDDIVAPRARLTIALDGYIDQQIEVINTESLGQIKLVRQSNQ